MKFDRQLKTLQNDVLASFMAQIMANLLMGKKYATYRQYVDRCLTPGRVPLISGFFMILLVLLMSPAIGHGTQLMIPQVTGNPGQVIEVPISVDKIDNLAGLKLVVTYDMSLLKYQKAIKSNHASSLMHIVNDKKPGRLIVVMAGAVGIKGKNLPIVTLVFRVSPDIKGLVRTPVAITESQLMSDKLKDISHTIDTAPLVIQKSN